jgi:hypothetical protein
MADVMVKTSEAERYRQAAEDALEQLAWCINYFRVNRKSQLSAPLAKSHDHIKRRLDREPAQPPTI